MGRYTYFGMAPVILAVPLLMWSLDPSQALLAVPEVVCFAALSCAFALLQDRIPLPGGVKALFAIAYGIGIVLLYTFWPWVHDLIGAGVRSPVLRDWLGMSDLLIPLLILLPVCAVFLGLLRGAWKWPERAYVIGAACLLVLFSTKIFINVLNIHYWPPFGMQEAAASVFWMPAGLAVATAGMLLGCARHEFHRPPRVASALAIGYLVVAALVPAGYFAALIASDTCAGRRHRHLGAQGVIAAVVDEVRRFSAHEQHDDITLTVTKCR